MIQNELEVFVDGLTNFFERFAEQKVVVGTPFLIENVNRCFQQYTGMIRVSGNHSGTVFFSASEPLLKNVLWSMKILDANQSTMKDLVGEIGNVVSGNARARFGDEFYISPPTFLEDHVEDTNGSSMTHYVIPVNWRYQKANLIIDLH